MESLKGCQHLYLSFFSADMDQESFSSFVLDPQYTELLALVKAARNGAVYGAKIRFPHALVMIFLFRSGSVRDKLAIVLKATKTHARNLATFAFLYKAVMLALRYTPRSPTKIGAEASYDSLVAGLIGGYIVFGRGSQSSVNQQIVIYVFARVVLALAKLSAQKGALIPGPWRRRVMDNSWTFFAAVSWGGVMWLYRWHPETIQPSLRSSMKYIYTNADHWTDLRSFLWHNT